MAVAGTVAPIFKGEYNPTVIYNFYNVVNHNNIMWICKVDGTVGIEPNKSSADYWYLAIDGADAASLGGETAETWQNKINTIIADLANYLPLSGGTIIGDTSSPLQLQSSDSSMAWLGFKNNNGVDMGAIGYNGENNPYVYLPNAGGKALIHAGNINNYALPLDGSKAMTGNLTIKKADGSIALATAGSGIGLIDLSINKWILRKFGGKYYVDDDKEILTKANSAPTVVSTSAPSDASALWYDTTNKVLKRYVDGAWQQ